MDAEEFVVRNLTDQATAFTQVADAMRTKLLSLPDAERAEVEQASRILRKMRASRAAGLDPHSDARQDTGGDLAGDRPLLPLTVANSADNARGSQDTA